MAKEIGAWFAGRIPDEWFVEPPDVHLDREEIVVVGALAPPPAQDDAEADAAARGARATRFREDTRDARIRIAEEAERRFGRKVSWGVRIEDERYLFTHAAVPVMTRLRFGERAVLDTLIDAGVARSRSEALSWCVRLVERNQGEWIDQLRDALAHVADARQAGPEL
jgi:hypothetical protein